MVQLRQSKVSRVVGTHGGAIHSGRPVLRIEGAREVVPGEIRYLAALPPDLPRFCSGRSPGALPWNLRDGHAQGHHRAVRDTGLTTILTLEGTKESIRFFFLFIK